MNHQMSPEDMLIQSASQLQNPREYEIDPALGVPNSHHHSLSYSHEVQYKPDLSRQSLPADVYGANYGEGEGQMMEGRSDEQDEVDSIAGASGPSKRPSKSSAANELEMRQLFQANKHRTLPEVATELHGNERGPQSERQRQVFAMLW
jgi:regulatory factor X